MDKILISFALMIGSSHAMPATHAQPITATSPLRNNHQRIFMPAGFDRSSLQSTPIHVEFAWDLHDVIFKPNIGGMINTIMGMEGRKVLGLGFCLLGNYIQYGFTGKIGKTQQFILDMKQSIKQSGGTGEAAYKVIAAYDSALVPVAREASAQMKVIKGMEEIIGALGTSGYTMRIASNIGATELVALKRHRPAIFRYVKDGKCLVYDNNGKIVGYRKPQVEYFTDFLETYIPADSHKLVIFIDDKRENVEAAVKAGMIGIHFINAPQLRNDLKALGFALR